MITKALKVLKSLCLKKKKAYINCKILEFIIFRGLQSIIYFKTPLFKIRFIKVSHKDPIIKYGEKECFTFNVLAYF